jgi:hypothetical protein
VKRRDCGRPVSAERHMKLLGIAPVALIELKIDAVSLHAALDVKYGILVDG